MERELMIPALQSSMFDSEQKNNNNNITNNMKSGAKRLSRSMAENIYSHIGQR